MFGYVNGGTVTNVNLAGVSITGNATEVGGVVGGSDNGTITNCTVSGTISGINYVGGVVGYSYNNGTVKNCTVSGEVTGNEEVGGVVGQSDNGTVTGCTVSGTIGGNATDVGGVVGKSFSSTVTNCTNTGTISGKNCIGGVVGISILGTVSNSSNNGEVTGCNGYVGGVIGYNYSSTVSDNTDTGTVYPLYKLTLPEGATYSSGGVYVKDNVVYAQAGSTITFTCENDYLKFGDTVVPVQDGSYTYTMTEQDINVETATYLDYAFEQQDDAYLIKTPQDLQGLAAFVNAGKNCEGLTFKLADDITLDETFTSIGTTENSFKGTFDGNDKTISNLTTDLFVNADEAAIQNFRIVGTAGDDVINLGYGSNVTIDALAGNDQIENSSAKVTIDGGTGSNTIILSGNTGTSDEQNVEDIVIKAGKGANNILVGANQKLTVNDFGTDDVISLNVLLEAENFNIVEGNLVAGNVTVGGLGDFVEGGTFSAADDGSIVYAGDATEAITVARATKNSNGDNTTSIVTERKEPIMADTYTFKLTGFEEPVTTTNNGETTTTDVVYTVHYTAAAGDTAASYYITKSTDDASSTPEKRYQYMKKAENDASAFDLREMTTATTAEGTTTYTAPATDRNYKAVATADDLFTGVATASDVTTVTLNGTNAEAFLATATTSKITIEDGAKSGTATYNLAIGGGYDQFAWSPTQSGQNGSTTGTPASWYVNLTKETNSGDWYVSTYENNTALKKVTATETQISFAGDGFDSSNLSNMFKSAIAYNGNEAIINKGLLNADNPGGVLINRGGLDILLATTGDRAVTQPTTPVGSEAKFEAVANTTGSFSYTSAAKTAGYVLAQQDDTGTATITYNKEQEATKIFTIEGLGSNFVTTTTDGKTLLDTDIVTEINGTYSIALSKTELEAALGGIAEGDFSTTIKVTPEVETAADEDAGTEAVNYTVTLGMAKDEDTQALKTTKGDTAGTYNTTAKTYTTPSIDAYYDIGTENQITAVTKQEALAFQFDDDTASKITSTDITNAISFERVNATAAVKDGEGNTTQAAIPAHYQFTLPSSILTGKDVVITKGTLSDNNFTADTRTGTAIYGAISGTDYDDGTEKITRNLTVADGMVTFNDNGYKAGYISQEAIAKLGTAEGATTGTFAEKLGTHTNAAIVYAGQRDGQSFTIEGLDTSKVTAYADLSDDAKKTFDDGTLSGENGIVLASTTTGEGEDATTTNLVVLKNVDSKPTLTVSAGALDAKDLVLKNVAATYETKEGVDYTDYALALDTTDGQKVLTLDFTVTEPTVSEGETYINKYTEAYNAAATKAVEDDSTAGVKVAATFTGTTTDETATTDTYKYTSSYNNAFYTKAIDYSSDNVNKDALIAAGLMANEKGVTYNFVAKNTVLKKTDFTISGLKKGISATEIYADAESGTVGNGVTIDYRTSITTEGVTTTQKPTIHIGSEAIDTAHGAIAITGLEEDKDGVSDFDVDFGTNGDKTVTFGFKNDETDTSKYTVQLAGNTGGYKLKEGSTTEYKWVDGEGCQQIEITGLAAGKTLTESMFTTDEKTGAIVFTPTDELIPTTAELTAGTTKIEITYKGKATANGTTTETTAADGTTTTTYTPPTTAAIAAADTTTFAFGYSSLSAKATKTPAHWEAKAATQSDPAGFVYKSAANTLGWMQTNDYNSTSHTVALDYAAAAEASDLLTLTGLNDGTTVNNLTAPTKCDSDGVVRTADNVYVSVTTGEGASAETKYYKESDTEHATEVSLKTIYDTDNALLAVTTTTGSGAEATTTTSYYKATDIITKSDAATPTYTVKTSTEDLTAVTRDSDSLFALSADVFDQTAMQTTAVTATYDANKKYHIAFGGSLATSTEPVKNEESLEETNTYGTYTYTGKTADAYFKDTPGETNKHTYNYVPELKAYSFTLTGMPSGKKTEDISSLFTFAEITDKNDANYGKYALTVQSQNAIKDATTYKDDTAGVLKLSDVKYDGKTSNDVVLALKTDVSGFSKAVTTGSESSFATTATQATEAGVSYAYKTAAYDKYFSVAEGGSAIDFNAATDQQTLFSIAGLSYAAAADNPNFVTELKTDTTKDATGVAANTAKAVIDEKNKTITLFASAFAGVSAVFTPKKNGTGTAVVDDNDTAYTVTLFDQDAYNLGLSAAVAAAKEEAMDSDEYATTPVAAQDAFIKGYTDAAEEHFKTIYGNSIVNTADTKRVDATMSLADDSDTKKATFTPGYKEAYYTDENGSTAATGTQTLGYNAQVGLSGAFTISGLSTAVAGTSAADFTIAVSEITDITKDSEVTYTVTANAVEADATADPAVEAKDAQELFTIVYTPAVAAVEADAEKGIEAVDAKNASYVVKPVDGALSAKTGSAPAISITGNNIDLEFDISGLSSDKATEKPATFAVTAVAKGETEDKHNYTFTAAGTTAGFSYGKTDNAEDKSKLSYTATATGFETINITGLKEDLTYELVEVQAAVAAQGTEGEEGYVAAKDAVKVPVLKDSSGKVVVCFADYDNWLFDGGDTSATFSTYQTNSADKKLRIAKEAVDSTVTVTGSDTKFSVSYTTADGYSFDGIIMSERVATTKADGSGGIDYTDNYFITSNGNAPTGEKSIFAETKNSDGTSDYAFEAPHVPDYFKEQTTTAAAGETTTTKTYDFNTTEQANLTTFTLKSLAQNLTVDQVGYYKTKEEADKDSDSEVVITDPTSVDETNTKNVTLWGGALPAATATATATIKIEGNGGESFTLALGENDSRIKTSQAVSETATFSTVESGTDKVLKYSSPAYSAYFTDNNNNTFTVTPKVDSASFEIIGLANDNFTSLTANKATATTNPGEYDATKLAAAGLSLKTTDTGKVTVTINENALPENITANATLQAKDSDADDAIAYTFTFGGELRAKAESGAAKLTQEVASYNPTVPAGTVVYAASITNYAYFETGTTDKTSGYTTYTYHEKVGGAEASISGLQTDSLLSADDLAAAVVVDESAKTITLGSKILESMPANGWAAKTGTVKHEGTAYADYTFAFADDTATAALTNLNTYGSFEADANDASKYTYTAEGTSGGYELGTDSKTIDIKAKTGETQFTIEGLKSGLALSTATTKDNNVDTQLGEEGITVYQNTVYVGKKVLDSKDIILTDSDASDNVSYSLQLDTSTADSVATSEDKAKKDAEFDVESGIATYTANMVDEYYTQDTTAAKGTTKFNHHDKTGGAYFTISGLSIADTTDAASIDGIAVTESTSESTGHTGYTVTISDTNKLAHGTVAVSSVTAAVSTDTISYDSPVLTVAEDATGSLKVADTAPTIAGAWAVETGTATYKAGGASAYFQTHNYTETTLISSLEYKAAVAAADKFALSGLVTTATTATEAGVEYTAGATADDAAVIKITTAAANVASADNGVSIASNAGEYIVDLNSAIKLTATANADKISVTAAGTVDAGAGNDFITVAGGGMVDGGAGNDTFDYRTGMIKFGEGNDTVNYLDGLTIYAPEGYTYSFQKAANAAENAAATDVLLKNGDNTLLITGAVEKTVNFYTELGGDKSEVLFDRDLGAMLTFDKAKGSTGVTLNGAQDVAADSSKLAYTGDSIGSNEFEFNSAALTIVTVDASHYSTAETGLTIEGNLQDNVIIGTNYGDTIDAKAGSDTVTGGKGNDIFAFSEYGTSLTIKDFSAGDTLKIDGQYTPEGSEAGTAISIASTAIGDNDITFTLNNEATVKLENVFSDEVGTVQVAITGNAESNYTYGKDGYILDGTSVTLASTYQSETGYVAPASITSITAQNTTGTTIDASANTAGVTVDATAAGNTVIGGTGADKFTGSDKADTFVYSAGADTVTNFDSLDAVSLGAEVGDISKIAVIADNAETAYTDESKVTFTFGEGKTLELDGAKDSVKVNGKNLFVGNDALYDTVAASATSVSLTSGATAADFSANENIVTIDASKVTAAIEIKGNAKDNVITAGTGSDTVTGGEGKDTFVYGGGALTITDYTAGEDTISVASDMEYAGVSFSGENDVVLNYGEGNTLTIKNGAEKAITFADGTNSIYSTIGAIDQVPPATTAITLAADTTTAFDPNNIKTGEGDAATLTYPNLSTINSGQVTTAIQVNALDTVASYLTNEGNATGGFSLVGGAQADTLVAGKGGDYLAGGAGADSIVAGDGKDTIVLAGNDTVKGFGTTDKLTTDGYTLDTASLTSIPAADETGTATADITLTLTKTTTGDTPTTDTITAALQGVAYDTLNGSTVSLDSKVYSFNANTIAEGTTLTVTGSEVAPAIPDNITTVDASKATNATITGGTATTSILGGSDADSLTLKVSGTIEGGEGADTLVAEKGGKVTGGEGNDIFAFNGGTLEITDYASGDKVSLRAADETAFVTAITMDDLKSITVTDAKESTASSASVAGSVALGFGTDSVTFSNLDDPTAAINIADKEYKFKTGLYGVGSEATVIAENTTVKVGDFTTVTGGKVTVDGSAATANLKLTLNDTGAALGGTGADTLIANAGGTLTGGDGKDVFSITGGTAATVTDYTFSDDTLYVDKTAFGEYQTIEAGEGKDAVLTFKSGDATKTVTLKDGADKNITIQYGSNKKDTVSAIVSSSGELNDAQTAITLNAGAGTFNASKTAFSKLASIDAHLDTVASATITANDNSSTITNAVPDGSDETVVSGAKLFLQGGAGDDYIVAGTKGDTLDGGSAGKKGDTLVGGAGADVFSITNTGIKTIENFDSESDAIALGEKVTLTGATIKDVAANTKKNIVAHTELTLAYDVATVNNKGKDTIVAGSATLTDLTTSTAGYKVNINDTEYTFLSDRITAGTAPNQAISLTSAYAGVTEGKKTTKIFEDTVGTYGTIDAAWTSKGFSLIGGGSEDGTSIRAVAITGGTGADTLKGSDANDTLTGGDGKDVFIVDGGNDYITDYVAGTDKISLGGDFSIADVTSVSVKMDSVTAEDEKVTELTSGTVILGFEDGDVSIHSDDDLTSSKFKGFTIADGDDTKGTAYFFKDNQITVGKNTITFFENPTEDDSAISLASDDYKAYTNVTAKYDGASIDATGKTARNIELTAGGLILGGDGKDTLIASGSSADTKTTLTGGKGNDMFIFNGGQVTITDYSTSGTLGNDTLAIADGWEITGATDGTIELSNGTATGSVTLQDFAAGSKINLATTDAKGKYKATSAYFTSVDDSAALADNASGAKAKGATVFGSGDFSSIYYTTKKNTIADSDTKVEGDVEKQTNSKGKLVAPTITAEYAALTTITAGSSDVTITGNDKANTITIENASSSTESEGSSVKGGLGNDTFIIGGGNATVDYFGIGTTAVYDETANGTATVKLASKITTTKSTKTSGKGDAATTVTTAYAYSTTDDAHNAQGKDVLKVDGTITGVEITDITTSTAKTDISDSGTFSVKLTYTDADGKEDNTIDLTNIVRTQKVSKSGNKTDGFTYEGVNSNADWKDLSSLQIWDNTGKNGASKKLAWTNKNGTVKLGDITIDSGDSDVASDDVFKDDNYTTGGDSSLSDIVSNDTADTAIGDLNAGTDTTGLGTVAASSDSDSIIKRTKKTK